MDKLDFLYTPYFSALLYDQSMNPFGQDIHFASDEIDCREISSSRSIKIAIEYISRRYYFDWKVILSLLSHIIVRLLK